MISRGNREHPWSFFVTMEHRRAAPVRNNTPTAKIALNIERENCQTGWKGGSPFFGDRGWNPDIIRISLLSQRWKRLLRSVHQPKIIESSLLIGYSETFCGDVLPSLHFYRRVFDSVRQRTNTRTSRTDKRWVLPHESDRKGIFTVKRTKIILLPNTSRSISRVLRWKN